MYEHFECLNTYNNIRVSHTDFILEGKIFKKTILVIVDIYKKTYRHHRWTCEHNSQL